MSKVVILGLGKTGLSCVHYFLQQGITPMVLDTRANPPGRQELPASVELRCGQLDVALLTQAELIIASPGIALATPALQAAAAAGVEIMKKSGWDAALKDIAAVLEFGKSAGKAGIVGYCWGGAVAWVAAARLPGLACAVPYYGGAIPSLLTEKLQCPVLLQFGETDQSIPLEKAKEVVAAYPEAESYFYPAGHGFNCDQRGSYDEASAKLARTRTLAFFQKHVG